jgi:hypothetical protein
LNENGDIAANVYTKFRCRHGNAMHMPDKPPQTLARRKLAIEFIGYTRVDFLVARPG